MRYSHRITFYKSKGRHYNPETGKTELNLGQGIRVPCNSNPLSIERTSAVFGSIKQNVMVARLQRQYNDEPDKAMIGTQKYNVIRHVKYVSESVFYLESVTSWT